MLAILRSLGSRYAPRLFEQDLVKPTLSSTSGSIWFTQPRRLLAITRTRSCGRDIGHTSTACQRPTRSAAEYGGGGFEGCEVPHSGAKVMSRCLLPATRRPPTQADRALAPPAGPAHGPTTSRSESVDAGDDTGGFARHIAEALICRIDACLNLRSRRRRQEFDGLREVVANRHVVRVVVDGVAIATRDFLNYRDLPLHSLTDGFHARTRPLPGKARLNPCDCAAISLVVVRVAATHHPAPSWNPTSPTRRGTTFAA